MLLLSLKNDWQPLLFELGRCENSFVDYKINYEKFLYSLRKIWTGPVSPRLSVLAPIELCVKGSQLHTFCSWAIVYCYFEFKLSYLKNLKLFSIKVKELSEPIVLWRKKTSIISSFYKHFSWETDLWVTLGDFTVKNAKFGREICI